MRNLAFAVAALAAALAAAPAWAGHDGDHGKGHDKGRHGPSHREDARRGEDSHVVVRFAAPQRVIVQNYYVTQIKAGHCPPGLAKKHNGCLPPGQAKKLWVIGRPLPPQVIYYPLPQPLIVELGPPPPGYRYARIANDVLLLAAGSGMVVDAIADLGRM
jgi:hypothetical protein